MEGHQGRVSGPETSVFDADGGGGEGGTWVLVLVALSLDSGIVVNIGCFVVKPAASSTSTVFPDDP